MTVCSPIALQQGSEPFPGYRLRAFLGQGAFSEVWSADRPNGRRVALKFLSIDQEHSTVKELRALQAIRQLNHPHLLAIEQVWCLPGYIVIAMELAEGTLADLLEIYQSELGTPITPAHCCELLSQAAEAIDHLNAQKHQINDLTVSILHCDVKPSNLFIFGDKLKVGDFGLAVILGGVTSQARAVGGTPNYAAPEVFRGGWSRFIDQFALAVSYCELRTGQLPFPDTPPSLRKSCDRSHPNLGLLTPPERTVVARALETIPDRRWPSCAEFMAHLTRAVQGKPVNGRIVLTPAPGPSFRSR
jgi:serine/threonine protein kinase, bacterial